MDVNEKSVNARMRKIDVYSSKLQELSEIIVSNYCKDLDKEMNKIHSVLFGDPDSITRVDLEDIILKLPPLLYWASQGQETVALKQEISTLVRDENFKDAFNSSEEKKVSQRNGFADTQVVDDTLVEMVYENAFKRIKSKINFGVEMLQSAKKLLSVSPEYGGNYKEPVSQDKKASGSQRRVF